MQSIQFLNEERNPYLLVSCDGVVREGYETRLFQTQKIPYFLQYEIREFNGKRNLYYPLRYRTSVKTIMEHLPFTVYQIQNMLQSIINVILTADEYLLHFDRIVWKSEKIFMEVDTGNLEFCYNPVEEQDNGSLQDFLSEIMSVTGKKNQDGFLLLLEFYNLITNPDYTLDELLGYGKERFKENLSQSAFCQREEEERKKIEETKEKDIQQVMETPQLREDKRKTKEKKTRGENVSVRLVRWFLIAIVLVNLTLIAGMLCNLLTYHYIRYLMAGMIGMIVITIVYMNVDKEDSADEIMKAYFENERELEPENGIVSEYPLEKDKLLVPEPMKKEMECNETTVLTAENDTRIFCLMPVIKGQVAPIYLQGESTVIGSWDKGCDCVIAKNGVSRMHCKLIQREKELYIMDLNSTNGTYLNGESLEGGKEYKVEEGDMIAFARLEFFVLLE